MAGDTNLNAGQIINIAVPLVLDAIAWFRRRQAESQTPPADAEVIAYVKGRLAAVIAEADAFEAEPPAAG